MIRNPFEDLKNVSSIEPTIQKVSPIKENKRANESRYMLWMDKNILNELKTRALKKKTNVKVLIEDAVRAYLSIDV